MKRIYLIAVSVILVATGISASQWNQQSPSASQTHRQSSIPTSTEALSPSIVPVPPSPTITPSATPPAPPTTTPATVPATPAPPASPTPHVSSPPTSAPVAGGEGDYAAWRKISVCENGAPGWNPPKGSAFPDSIGFTAANWYQFGGGSDLSPSTQIAVGNRFMAHYGMALPDQNGCSGSY